MIPKILTCAICGAGSSYKVLYKKSFNDKSHLNTKVFSARRSPDRVHGTIIKCDSCGLVRTKEKIESSTLEALYRQSKFTYKTQIKNLIRSYSNIISDNVSIIPQRQSYLEIGCGSGFLFQAVSKLGFTKIYGVEPSEDAVKKSSPQYRKNIKVGILKPGLFPDSSFDLICAFQVFDHLPDPSNFLKICHKLLKPDGVLLLMNHNVDAFFAKLLGDKNAIFDIEHTYLYSPKTIQIILEKNRFKVVRSYSPSAFMSLRYIARLLPLPHFLKNWTQLLQSRLIDTDIKIKPGNLAVFSVKKK